MIDNDIGALTPLFKGVTMKILSVANQKGGAAKTTTAAHVAWAAQEKGLRVLVVDLDKQGNMSYLFKGDDAPVNNLKASQLFFRARENMHPQVCGDFGVIGADFEGLERVESTADIHLKQFYANLQAFSNDYDLCVIDTPPSLGKILRSAIIASDYVLTPFQIGVFEMAGASQLLGTMNSIRSSGQNPKLKHLGILPSKIKTNSPQELESLAQLQKKYGKVVFSMSLAERSAVKQAVASKAPVWQGAKGESHRLARDEWRAAMAEVLKRMEM